MYGHSPAVRDNLFEFIPLCCFPCFALVLICKSVTEQRKATLRRAEMELDEADDIVRAVFPALHHFPT